MASLSTLATVALALSLCTGATARRWQRTCCTLELGFDPVAAASQAKRLTHPSHSRDYGVLAEAMLELYNPEYTVFSDMAFPYGVPPILDFQDKVQGLTYALWHTRTQNTTLRDDGGDATGDPAALGIAAVMMGQKKTHFMDASTRQYEYFSTVPRYSNGAMSSAEALPELSADWIYNVPPFFAYYGVATNDVQVVRLAVEQCRLYRQALGGKGGPWQHIVGPKSQDHGLWSTGNGWAAMGMLKVLAILSHWSATNPDEKTAIADIYMWIGEILKGAMEAPREAKTGLLRNYLDDSSSFGETSGTSILSAAVYRLAVLQDEPGNSWLFDGESRTSDGTIVEKQVSRKMLDWADENLAAVAQRVDKKGIATPAVVDRVPSELGSAEGQSFLVMLYSAYRDCVLRGTCASPQQSPHVNCRAKSEHFICRELPVDQWPEKLEHQ